MANLALGPGRGIGYSLPNDAAIGDLLDLTPTVATSTTFIGDFRLEGEPTNVMTFSGSGFSYTPAGMPFGGTVNAITQTFNGQLVFHLSAISVSVGSLVFWAQTNQTLTAVSTILNGDDNIAGSPFSDTLNGYTGNDRIQGSFGLDLILGSDGSDALFGEGDTDTLSGGNGDDTLDGGVGGDSLSGGTGYDVASYATAGGGVSVSLQTGTGWSDDASGDRLNSIESLRGSRFGDFLYGNSDHNIIEGGAGADVIAAAGGNDWVSYENAAGAIAVNLAITVDSGWAGDAAGDDISGVENIRGSAFNDYLYGDAGANILRGDGGGDVLYGGANSDTIYYSTSTAAVVVDLSTNSALGGDAQGDTLVSVENVFATAFNDALIGDSASNTLVGWLGVDTLTGNGGNDIFRWSSLNESGSGAGARDIVTDFWRVHGDRLDVSGIDAHAFFSGDQAFNFISTAGFSGAGQARYFFDGLGNTIVEFNVDNSLTADMQIQLFGTIFLVASDFFL